MCPKIIERWEAEPWKGFQIPHRDFARSVKNGGVLVRCSGRRVRAEARGRPHGLDGNGPLHAAPELPGRRDVGPRPRGQGTPCHLLLRREGVPARCSACTRFCHTSHVTRCIWRAPNTRLARQLRSWRAPISISARANSSVGARRVTSWRAKYPVGARQVQFWRAPSPVLARQVTSWRAPSPVLALGLVLLETLLCGLFLCCLGCRIGVVVCIVQCLFSVMLCI